jgi:hypothetical protein
MKRYIKPNKKGTTLFNHALIITRYLSCKESTHNVFTSPALTR